MTSLLNPVTGAPVIGVAAAMAAAGTADAALASKVGWFNVNNISSALFGLPAGFLVMWAVSMVTPAPSKEMQEFIDEVRKPRGKTMMVEKTS
jgi:cation/acetate symporter